LSVGFERAQIKLVAHFDPALPPITVDAEKLWEAILNLIRNSCEAMPNGGQLTVGTSLQEKQVLLRVIDNGNGMTDKQKKRLFEPFFTTKKGGTGLGLVMAQQVVTEHAGYIECESTEGKGSTFTICLPIEATFLTK
jgi:signal transduction histidine kinase